MAIINWYEINPIVVFANEKKCDPEFECIPRYSDTYHFIYIVSGRGLFHIQDRTYKAMPKDLFVLSPGVVYSFQADKGDPLVLYGLHFHLATEMPRCSKDISLEIVNVSSKYHAGPANKLQILGELLPFHIQDVIANVPHRVKELLKLMIDIYDITSHASNLLARAYTIQLLSILYEFHQDKAVANPKMDKVYASLHSKAEFPYDRNWLKEWTNYSHDYVCRLFKEQYGYSPHELFLKIKVKSAKTLLQYTDLSVTEISEKLSFGSVYYFSKSFKDSTGLSPSQFRRGSLHI